MAPLGHDDSDRAVAYEENEPPFLQFTAERQILSLERYRPAGGGELLEEPTLHVAQCVHVVLARLLASRTAAM